MNTRVKLLLTCCLLLLISASAQGQHNSAGQNIAEMKFAGVPGLPTCAPGSVQKGDPTKGPFIVVGKIPAGCTIPWHWHTPNEHLMMVSGVARLESKDGKPFMLRAGGFAMMPSGHVHQFRCVRNCVLYIYSDAPWDIHYLNTQGKEISPAEALRPFKETAATP